MNHIPYLTLPNEPLTVEDALATGLYGLYAYALTCGVDIPAGTKRAEVVRALWLAHCLVEDPVSEAVVRAYKERAMWEAGRTYKEPKDPIPARGPDFSPYDNLRVGTEPGTDPDDGETYDEGEDE